MCKFADTVMCQLKITFLSRSSAQSFGRNSSQGNHKPPQHCGAKFTAHADGKLLKTTTYGKNLAYNADKTQVIPRGEEFLYQVGR